MTQTTLFTDDFNRADAANLGDDWGTLLALAPIPIFGNRARTTAYGVFGQTPLRPNWPADHWAQVVAGPTLFLTDDGGFGPIVRHNAAADTFIFFHSGAVDTRLYRYVAAVYTLLGTVGPAVSSGDVLYLDAIGRTITAKINGVPVCGTPLSDVPSLPASGRPGLWCFNAGDGNVEADDFAAGGFVGTRPRVMGGRVFRM